MSFDWLEYLNVAQELAGQPDRASNEEAKLRSSISRAYYAAFIKARNFLRDNEGMVISNQPRVHEYVPRQFEQSRDKKRQQIGYKLRDMRHIRNQADYDDVVLHLPELSKKTLKLARQVILRLESL